ncbi:MAG: tRNA uridine(34) 5-carboxymethylaminomethyl modification radical SAM/GNAT enzyme Elp3 [Thermoproteota archaeon]|nr:tRNA uridine(34) 5-carboxymethylaminomethyl modification radical SAM/GNAT enzyme Elp3 [Thermoproteota archaeon]
MQKDSCQRDFRDPSYERACSEIALGLQRLINPKLKDISTLTREKCSKYRLSSVPRNEDILKHIRHDSEIIKMLKVRPVKTASGVAVIAVMPKPYNCPQGRCIYCPGGLNERVPLSYTGSEPCTKYAQRFDFDPYMQIRSKIDQLSSRGHGLDKVELVIVGGTFPFFPIEYQKEFAKHCFDALNNSISNSLEEAMELNENAGTRCVGFTVETKPDYCKAQHVDVMLQLGITRVEIGIQSLHDDTYKAVNRGHTLLDVRDSFQIARDAGYKIVAHMMPGLPHANPQQDIKDFHTLFGDPCFKPDMLKIYPTLVLKNTGLFNLYKNGRYIPYSRDDYIKILVEVKKKIPPWVRIMRVQREIEDKDIVAGPKEGNLRQLALLELKEQGHRCRCIRCREAGLQNRIPLQADNVQMSRVDYTASGGKEVFLSLESCDNLSIFGFLRLRQPALPHRPEIKGQTCIESEGSAIIRELHVYGVSVSLGRAPGADSCQHRGYGIRLMREAEQIVKDEFGLQRLSVISAVGTREYYKRLGYSRNGPYMTKAL